MVDVGAPSPDGIGGISKQSLLIGALVIGGGIGLVVFLSRKANAPSATAENKAQLDVPVNNMAYQNLAEQLLGFRGDVSVANANLAQGEQDILSQMGADSAARASENVNLSTGIANLMQYSQGINSNLTSAQNDITTRLLNPEYRPPANVGIIADANPGAGGAIPRDAILAAFGANDDDADYYLARMSAGPVRQLTNRSY